MLVGEGKHGVWRFQENGFIRIYRGVGKEGIPPQKREGVRDLRENIVIDDDMEDKESAWEINRLLIILERNSSEMSSLEPLSWISCSILHVTSSGLLKIYLG